MKMKFLRKTALLALAMMAMGESNVCAQTLAAWDFTTTVRYTTTDDGTSRYYTPSAETYTFYSSDMKDKSDGIPLSDIKPYFYPTSCGEGLTSTDFTLTLGGNKWGISSYNSGALRFWPNALVEISDYANPAQHYNYAEISLNATGYKNLKFSGKVSGNNGKSLPLAVAVSTDGGSTWAVSQEYTTGSSWNNFSTTNVNLAVDNQSNVKVRILIGYRTDQTTDMYLNNFKITGEAMEGETVYSLSAATANAEYGTMYASPVGQAAIGGTSFTLTATNNTGYAFSAWKDGSNNSVSTDNPYTFTLNENTSLEAVFNSVVIYTFTANVNMPWAGNFFREGSNKGSSYSESFSDGTQIYVAASANSGFTFVKWSDGNTDNPRYFTMNQDVNITAIFKQNAPTYNTTTTIANWTFDGDYNVANGDGNTLICTPKGYDHAAISHNYSDNTVIVRPDYYQGSIEDYAMTVKCDRNWSLEDFNNRHERYVLFFHNNTDETFTTVTDATDASQHTNYYEASFPTLLCSSLNISMELSANNEKDDKILKYAVVYSIDNGSTWNSLDEVTTLGHWNAWQASNFDLPADAAHQAKVIVRIIRMSDFGSGYNGDNKLNYFTVTGTFDAEAYKIPTMGIGTFCSTNKLDFSSTGATPYIITDGTITDSKITATSVEGVVPAETGIIVKGTGGVTISIPVSASETTASVEGNKLVGVTEATEITYSSANSYYVVSDGALHPVTATGTIAANRAYLYLEGVPSASRSLTLVFSDDEITGIDNLNRENVNNNRYFDLQGRVVAQPTKGLYIVNGKKVVIK